MILNDTHHKSSLIDLIMEKKEKAIYSTPQITDSIDSSKEKNRLWMMPDGMIYDLKNMPLKNFIIDFLNEDLGEIEDEDSESIHKKAIQYKMIKLLYDKYNKTLNITAPLNNWNRKIRRNINNFIINNLKDINIISILVLDRKLRVVKDFEFSLEDNTPIEKIEKINSII